MLNMQAAVMPAMLSAHLTLVVEFFKGFFLGVKGNFTQLNSLCYINEEVIISKISSFQVFNHQIW